MIFAISLQSIGRTSTLTLNRSRTIFVFTALFYGTSLETTYGNENMKLTLSVLTSFCRLSTLLVFTGEGLIEMKLKEHAATWPPDITMEDASQASGIPPNADLADVVLDVRNGFLESFA